MIEVMRRFLFLLVMLAGSVPLVSALPDKSHAQRSLPYASFPVLGSFNGSPVAARIKGERQHRFRSAIQDGAKSGPNFAGHYTFVSWGCGTSCSSYVIVDAVDGKVFEPKTSIVGFGNGSDLPDGVGVFFRLDSRLLAINGCTNALFVNDDDSCGEHLFVMEPYGIRQLSFKRMNLTEIESEDVYKNTSCTANKSVIVPLADQPTILPHKRKYVVVPLDDPSLN